MKKMRIRIKKLAVLLLMMSVFTMAFGETATPAIANGISSGDVVINEIMWMGSSASIGDEWIELRNTTEENIDLSNCQLTKISNDVETLMLEIPEDKSIAPQSYFLISEYDKENSSINIDPDFVVGAGDTNNQSFALANSELQIKLYCGGAWDNGGILIDTADDGTGAPLAGDNGDIKKSMSRKSTPGDGTLAENWCTSETSVNWDAGANEKGTPGKVNDCSIPPDTTPPVCDNGLPTGELTFGTTETTLSLTTNENADCRYSTAADTEYSLMTDTFSITGETDHSTSITGLENGQSYAYYVRCQDELENANTDDFPINFSVASEVGDTTPPAIINYTLNGAESDVTFNPDSDEPIEIILNANEDVHDWISVKIENADDSGIYKTYHPGDSCDGNSQCAQSWDGSLSSGTLVDGSYKIKVKMEDEAENVFDEYLTPYVIIVDTTASDATPPFRDNGLPTGELAVGTTETTLSLTTDEKAACKYSTIAETSYADMTEDLSVDEAETSHTASITNLENGQSYSYYVRCQDELENVNADDYEISFSVASPQSSGGSGGFTPSSVSSSNKPLTVLSFQKGEMTQRLNDENKVKVEIPKGSVKSKTTFTASKGSLANGDAPKNKVGAFLFNGLVFNIEAVDLRGDAVRDFSEDLTITLTVSDLPDDTSNLELYYFDKENQEWVIVSDVKFGNNTITFKVNHLTQFAVFEIPKSVVKGASDIILFDGDVIRNPGAQGMARFDVYVVKIIGDKKFKRLILNPDIFESYGHLDWENIKLVDQAAMDSFALSNLARCGSANVEADSFKVYRLIPKNDTGTKQHLNITAAEFGAKNYNWNSVYIINAVDMNVYISGPDII